MRQTTLLHTSTCSDYIEQWDRRHYYIYLYVQII